MSLPLPSEAQARVVKFSQSGPQKGVLKVIAPAGSGKTTTLLMVTLANAGKKILYVAFNREIARSAKVKFNGYADALTINAYVRRLLIQESTAYERRIALFEEKSRDGFWGNSSRVEKFYYDRIKEIEPKTFDLEETDESEPVNMDVAALTLRRILGFAKSSAVTVEEYLKDKTDKDPLLDQVIKKAAVKFWEMFLSNSCLWPLDFLVQVKLAQTSGILERALGSYAIVLFDEAQDASDVVLGAMKNADTKIIYVGDPHQHIYGFTGTVDAFEKIDGPVAELTESYRFGQAIADVCNK
ncbi:MAG: ATP-dependent helicase, partial [Pedobacter sp.]